MTYGWNPGPDDPRHGEAARDDPDLPYLYGSPDGQRAGDRAFEQPSGEPEARHDHAPEFPRAPGEHRPPGSPGAGVSAGADAAAGQPSQWQPGYEPFGYEPPGQPADGFWLPQANQPAAVEQKEAQTGEHARYRAPRYQGASGSQSHWRPGYEPPGYGEAPNPWQPGREPSRGARPEDEQPGHEPQDGTKAAKQSTNRQSGHEPPAVEQPEYEPLAVQQREYEPSAYQRPEYDPPYQHREPQPPVDPAGVAYGYQADSGVAGRDGQPSGYQHSGYEPPGYQPPGAADVVTYGYKSDHSDAGHQQAGGPAAVDGASAYPDWAGQPGPDHPEFALYGPSESEPQAAPAPAAPFTEHPPRRATRGRRRLRVWSGVGAVLVIVVAAAAVLTGRLGHSGQPAPPAAAPSRTLATPQQIGAYTRDQQAEQQLGLSHGEQYVTQIDAGHVSGIVAAVYDTGGPASSPDRVAVIAGRLVNSPLADVIKSFKQQEGAERNAPVTVPAGPLGGQAACAGNGSSGICVWADRDTVGVLVSATMKASSLARMMLTIRSGVELPAA